MINNHLQSFKRQLKMIYNDLQPFTTQLTINYNIIVKNNIGTVHNGLSMMADGLLTKVQATGEA